MAFFDNLSKKVADTARTAAKKSGDLIEIAKINSNINSEEDKIEKVYLEMGKVIYSAYQKGDESAAKFAAQCEQIKNLEASVAELRRRIQDVKGVKNCTVCGAELEMDVMFCSKCGSKQEPVAPKEDTAGMKACPACGALVAEGNAFCNKCGAKMS
ncbi:MAG: zinc ribbon domain-containing protein [Eubacteriales bacterium]|nr:zinc ribbon domain-containing protein [Eubacteriales bacterium]